MKSFVTRSRPIRVLRALLFDMFYVPLRLYLPNVIPAGPLHILRVLGTLIHPLLICASCILSGITLCFDWLHSSLSTVG